MVTSNNNNRFVMGFDYGTKYIGVAIGQTTTNTANPLTCITVANNKIDWQLIQQLINTWAPSNIIVGLPTPSNRSLQTIYLKANKFMRQIYHKFKIPVVPIDESLTTWEAKKNLQSEYKTNLSKDAIKQINATAAAIILNQWLNQNN